MNYFDGVHGTDEGSAARIQQYGFVIIPKPSGDLMYGNGIYFYQNSIDGRRAACQWGKRKVGHNFSAVRLSVKIDLDDHVMLDWTQEKEKNLRSILAKLSKLNTRDTKIKNQLRWVIIERLIKQSDKGEPVGIFTTFLVPNDSPKKSVKGCVFYSLTILPRPPFIQEKCHE